MYVVQSPVVAPELAERARRAARGPRQKEWIWWMLGPGLDATFTGRWANSTRNGFVNCCTRLAQAGIKTEALPLGYEGKRLFFITGELDPAETLIWRCKVLDDYERAACISAMTAAGLLHVEHVRRALLLIERHVPWQLVVDALTQDEGAIDREVADLAAELMGTRLTLRQALKAARLAVSL